MAAAYPYQPGCYSADMMPSKETRKRLLKADAFHDLTDRGRLKNILQVSWAERLGVSVTNEQVEYVKDFFYNIINRYHHDINICDLMNPTGQEIKDEDKIITAFYGSSVSYLFPPIPPNPNDINNTYPPLTDHKVVRFTNESGLRAWLDYMKTTLFPDKRYVLDHTAISEGTLCDVIPNISGAAPILDTIGKAYDRSTILPPNTSCKEKIEYELAAPYSVLTKRDGELLSFDTIYILNTNQLGWQWNGREGVININYMASVDRDIPENLSAIVIDLGMDILKAAQEQVATAAAFLRALNPGFIYKVNRYIIEAYGFSREIVDNNLDAYALGLMEFKRMGDLLQVKLAGIHKAVFVSNDRVAILMAAIGYKIPALRTYVKREGTNYNYEMSVYNLPLDAAATAAAQTRAAAAATAAAAAKDKFKKDICRASGFTALFRDEEIKALIQVKNSYYSKSSESVILNINDLYYLDTKNIIYRAIYIILSYLLTLHGIINENLCKNDEPVPVDLFVQTDNYTVIEGSIHNIYLLLQEIYKNSLQEKTIGDLIELLKKIKTFINTNEFSLFGEYLQSYITIVNKVLEVKETGRGRHIPLIVSDVQTAGIVVGHVKGGKKLIDRLTYFENYIQSLCTRYNNSICRSGGNRTRKVNNKRNMKGGFKPLSSIDKSPSDLLDYIFGTLIQYMYAADSSKDLDTFNNLFILYLQLQLITQQYNMSFLFIKPYNINEEIQQITEIVESSVLVKQKLPINNLTGEKGLPPAATTVAAFSVGPRPNAQIDIAAAAEGGNKKSKSKAKEQPVKGGKPKKKDEVKKEVKGGKAKKSTTDKKKST
jgi:hypothetical protein